MTDLLFGDIVGPIKSCQSQERVNGDSISGVINVTSRVSNRWWDQKAAETQPREVRLLQDADPRAHTGHSGAQGKAVAAAGEGVLAFTSNPASIQTADHFYFGKLGQQIRTPSMTRLQQHCTHCLHNDLYIDDFARSG